RYLADYRNLCRAAATSEEQQRRSIHYYQLLARGREQQDRLRDAWRACVALQVPVDATLALPKPDDPAVAVRTDLWLRDRFSHLLAKADPEQRALLEAERTHDWNAARAGFGVEGLRNFLARYGDGDAVGLEARFLLAQRLSEEGQAGYFLEA